jgi:hypothetical protein
LPVRAGLASLDLVDPVIRSDAIRPRAAQAMHAGAEPGAGGARTLSCRGATMAAQDAVDQHCRVGRPAEIPAEPVKDDVLVICEDLTDACRVLYPAEMKCTDITAVDRMTSCWRGDELAAIDE